MMQVHQLLSSIVPGDAVSNYAFYLQKLLQNEGYESEIFAENIHPDVAERCCRYVDYAEVDRRNSILFVHYSIASTGMLTVPDFSARKILFYHNVTPYRYWLDINQLAAFHCFRGRTDLPVIAPSIAAGVAFSEFSLRDLKQAGIQKCVRVPIAINMDQLKLPPDPVTLKLNSGSQKHVLVVGRLAPNKKLEDALRVASLLQKVRFLIIGSAEGSGPYYSALLDMSRRLGANVDFIGHISQAELNAYYRVADAMLITSEHEGFCVPILEAFYFGVPVVARAAGAIPETANGGALLFGDKEKPEMIAAALGRVLADPVLSSAMKVRGESVLKDYLSISIREIILTIIRELQA